MSNKTHTFRAWIHPEKALSLVYSNSLDGWTLKKHRKDGKVVARFPIIWAAGPSRETALQSIRRDYDQRPPISGWTRATIRTNVESWNLVHEIAYLSARS